jgi:hypothetical protein
MGGQSPGNDPSTLAHVIGADESGTVTGKNRPVTVQHLAISRYLPRGRGPKIGRKSG